MTIVARAPSVDEAVSIAAITPYTVHGASSRVRVHEWASRVPEMESVISSRVSGGGWYSPRTHRRIARSSMDLLRLDHALRAGEVTNLLLHREAMVLGRGLVERRLLQQADMNVYDFDDALHEDHGGGTRSLFPKSAIVSSAVEVADRVIAANDELATWASERSSDVVVIPSCIDPMQYRHRVHDGSRAPDLVWLGSASTSVFLFEIADALREVSNRFGCRLRAVGAHPSVASIGDFVECLPWYLGIEKDLSSFGDIGIMPLPDTPFARGKSAYKILQYGAAAMPAVASDVGASAGIADRIGVSVASTTDEWVDAMSELLASASLRRTRGSTALERVASEYSYECWLDEFRRAVGLTDRPMAVAAPANVVWN